MYGSVGPLETEEMKKEEAKSPQFMMLNVQEGAVDNDDHNTFEDKFDQNFWTAVHQRYGEKVEKNKQQNGGKLMKDNIWSQSLDEVRAERIKTKYKALGIDPIVAMMKEWLGRFKSSANPDEVNLLLPSFENQVSRLALVLLHESCEEGNCSDEKHNCEYGENKRVHTEIDGTRKTLLHIAAEENLTGFASSVMKYFPGQIYIKTKGGPDLNRIPLEFALIRFNDDVASAIISKMHNDRVRKLMEFDKMEQQTRFRFCDYIERKDMQKTVVAILDSMINPNWPMIPVENIELEEEEWSKVPDVPVRYHFFYRILDGDDEGRPPFTKMSDGSHQTNLNFDYKSESCLKKLLRSPHKEIAIRHPVIRKLADNKWEKFGKMRVRFYAVVYFLFLICMSLALLSAVKLQDPLKYSGSVDHLRMVCEVLTIITAVSHVMNEIMDATLHHSDWGLWDNWLHGKDFIIVSVLWSDFKSESIDFIKECGHFGVPSSEALQIGEPKMYCMDITNVFDIFGSVSILALIPLRLKGYQSQWSLASASYLVNFLRILKFFPAWPFVGMYVKVLWQMVVYDMTKFCILYLVVIFSFGGSILLALKASTGITLVNGFWGVFLKEIRALAEGNPFSDSYNGFNTVVIILIMANMIGIIIMLVNMLIAQLSYRYEEALNTGEVQYDIDKATMIAQFQQSNFKRWNLRVKHYTDGDYVNKSEVKSLIESWKKLKEELDI